MDRARLTQRPVRVFWALALASMLGAAVPSAEADPLPASVPTPTGRALTTAGITAMSDSIRWWIGAGLVAHADSVARVLSREAEERYGAGSAEAAAALDVLVEVLWRTGKGTLPETRPAADRAIALHRDRNDPPAVVAASRKNLACILLQLGQISAARDTLRDVLEVQRRELGATALATADTEQRLASVWNNLGEEETARELGARALATLRQKLPPGDPRIGDCLNDQAVTLNDLGAYDEAQATYQEALEVYVRAYGPENSMVALVRANVARLRLARGDYTGAREDFERAVAIQEGIVARDTTFTGNFRRLAFTLTFLGETLEAIGEYAAARDSLERARQIRERVLGPTHTMLAPTLMQLANVYADLGELDHAAALDRRALAILAAKAGRADGNYATASLNLADILSRSGHDAEAVRLASDMMRSLTAAFGARHPITARGLASLAVVHARNGDLEQGASELRQALDIGLEFLGDGHPELARMEALLARVCWAQGQGAEALDLALRAEQWAREHLALTGRSLSEREALSYAATRAAGLGIALSAVEVGAADSARARVFDALVRSRALVLDEMASRHRAVALASDSEAVRRSAALLAATNRYANLAVEGPDSDHPERFRRRLDEAREAKEAAERALAEVSAPFRARRDETRRGASDVRAALPRGAALVSYVRYEACDPHARGSSFDREETRYAAFALGPEGTLNFVPLGAGDRVEEAVAAWREEAARGAFVSGRTAEAAESACRRAGHRLRRLIWDPLARSLGTSTRVFVVPDGALSFVSFDALPADHGGYLADGPAGFHYLSAERDLTPMPSRERNSRFIAFGGLDFDEADPPDGPPRPERVATRGPGDNPAMATVLRGAIPCGLLRSARFPRLPGTSAEVEEIAALWERSRRSAAVADGGDDSMVLLEGSHGTEEAFKRFAPEAGLLHVASHGFFIDGGCAGGRAGARGIGGLTADGPVASGVPGAAKTKRPKHAAPPRSESYENPFLLAGLVFAGANDRSDPRASEDGILTADEVAAMDLSRVRWAVLSACETGTGRATTGEGLLGFRRAFQAAGVGTLIMSLWPADDEGTKQWMRTLYERRLLEGMGASDAVRAATRGLLRARRADGKSTHPFFWAGFIATGDWR